MASKLISKLIPSHSIPPKESRRPSETSMIDDKELTGKDKNLFITYRDEESLSSSSTEDHVFRDPQIAAHYKDLYESTDYECRHLFDPELTWTEEEEKKVVRRNDWYVTFWAFIMFTALDFDRYNISQALSANMLDHLHLTTEDYNLGNTINLMCFLASELPSQLISKKLGADIWIPTQLCLWSAVSMCQAAMTTRAGFLATRGLLGALQGGFICDVCLWMSYFFTSKELPFRLSLFYIANPMTSVWSSLLSFALLKIKTGGLMDESFRWLFLIEGIFTFAVGVISFFKMPASGCPNQIVVQERRLVH
ncbi:AIG_G0006470.mRNA.1.CDS.1 [Saccharomyces cerevisiae]|nr:AIG_G0006470.mRNA.1.CDS.1 [Saccharomyces cerevisiae]CAI6526924.1 AIG_G0006470.mRNA.1.CDS.1 [Saccharomyces cerevisiae]